MKKGFTFLELLIVIAIIAIISAIIVGAFSMIKNNQALEKDVSAIIAYLDDAKSKTLASKDSDQYGVHFTPSTISLFKGAAYNVSDPGNLTYQLDDTVTLNPITIAGGGSDVIFTRLTGGTPHSGTITASSTRTLRTKTITIYATGGVQTN